MQRPVGTLVGTNDRACWKDSRESSVGLWSRVPSAERLLLEPPGFLAHRARRGPQLRAQCALQPESHKGEPAD
jgi:hypothetical protein